MSTYADWQSIQQWTGDPLAQATAAAIAGGTVDTGALQVGSWASIIVWAKASVQPVTAVVTQTIAGGPPGLTISQTITIAAGSQSATSIIMYGTTVEIVFTGGGAGCLLDYAIVPSNTSVATSVSSNPIITRVTALPAAPVDTQVVSFVPDAVTFPGVEWLCIYNASTGFWDVIGGSPLYVYDTGSIAEPNTAVWTVYGATTLTLAHEGYYDCRVEGSLNNTFAGAAQTDLGLRIDGVDPVDSLDAATMYTGAAGPRVQVARDYFDRHIAAAGVVRPVFMSQQTSTIGRVKYCVMPRRIK